MCKTTMNDFHVRILYACRNVSVNLRVSKKTKCPSRTYMYAYTEVTWQMHSFLLHPAMPRR